MSSWRIGSSMVALAACALSCGGKSVEAACHGDSDTSADALSRRCRDPLVIFDDPVTQDPYVPCRLYETFRAGSPECACDAPGYASVTTVPTSVTQAIRADHEDCVGACCSELCVCELFQLKGAELDACLYQPFTASPPGWCYVDVDQGVGVPGFEGQIAGCGHGLRIRTEWPNFDAYLACQY